MAFFKDIEFVIIIIIISITWTLLLSVVQINILNFDANELKVWSRLEHPDVVSLYGAMVYSDSVYIFQELITGLLSAL